MTDANVEVYHAFSYVAEWLYQEDIQLGWLRCLDAMLARDATLREALEAAHWTGRSVRVRPQIMLCARCHCLSPSG